GILERGGERGPRRVAEPPRGGRRHTARRGAAGPVPVVPERTGGLLGDRDRLPPRLASGRRRSGGPRRYMVAGHPRRPRPRRVLPTGRGAPGTRRRGRRDRGGCDRVLPGIDLRGDTSLYRGLRHAGLGGRLSPEPG